MFRQRCSHMFAPESGVNGVTDRGCAVCVRPSNGGSGYVPCNTQTTSGYFDLVRGPICNWVPPGNSNFAYENNFQRRYLLRMPPIYAMGRPPRYDNNLFGLCTSSKYVGEFLLTNYGCSSCWVSEELPVCSLVQGDNTICTECCRCLDRDEKPVDPRNCCAGLPYVMDPCSIGSFCSEGTRRFVVRVASTTTSGGVREQAFELLVVYYPFAFGYCAYQQFRTDIVLATGGDRYNCRTSHRFLWVRDCEPGFGGPGSPNWRCGTTYFPVDPFNGSNPSFGVPEIFPID